MSTIYLRFDLYGMGGNNDENRILQDGLDRWFSKGSKYFSKSLLSTGYYF